jgi:tRNA pseudouridine(55) synthase
MTIPRYVVLEKAVGETPLSCAEAWRSKTGLASTVPLAYAGRLDPMASGKLLVLIGDECKVQEQYHGLDKRYEFSVLFGVGSDTGDVLGRLSLKQSLKLTPSIIKNIASTLTGDITLPYPHFSAKTVQGKPLHMWTLEGRLHEITIPTQSSTVYSLTLVKLETKTRTTIYTEVSAKIETIPKVTEVRKALGNDFRRTDVRADWANFNTAGNPHDEFQIATFVCIASSGTYMRSLAEEIGKLAGTKALAYHINRTHIGTYKPLLGHFGLWTKQY